MYDGEDIKQEQTNRKAAIMKGFGFEQSDSMIEKAGEGSKGGTVIGHTKSGKAIYATQNAKHEKTYNSADHKDAAYAHLDESTKHAKTDEDKASRHSDEYDRHMATHAHKKVNEELDKEDTKK